jgi:adenosylcobinamide-phosphate synthase
MPTDWFQLLAGSSARGGVCTALAVLVALGVDRVCGEPAVRFHPVVWMGKALGACGARFAPRAETGRDIRTFWIATIGWCGLAALLVIAAAGLQFAVNRAAGSGPFPFDSAGLTRLVGASFVLGLLLKPLMALAMLRSEVAAVELALTQSLAAGRARLARLVSRDVALLSASEVRESAIESLAENLNDSVVAPLFWFVLLGLPGAALYRFANTADAMWGYPGMRGGHYWQWAGKWAARADDGLSWVPARITALLLAAVAGGLPLPMLKREARCTASPNSGWPMAAMALVLDVRLSKRGCYALNASGGDPTGADVARADNLVSKVAIALTLSSLLAILKIAIRIAFRASAHG